MKKGKVKEFFEKHKTAFTIAASVTATAVVGAVGYKLGQTNTFKSLEDGIFIPCKGVTEPACKVLDDIPDKAYVGLFGGISDTPFAPSQLGELGKAMLESGATEEDAFTHFVAIGKK